MPHQSLNTEDMFLTVIFVLAALVFVVMLIFMTLMRRLGAKTKGHFRFEKEHKPNPQSPEDGLPVRSTASWLNRGMRSQNGLSDESVSVARDPFWDKVVGISQWVLCFGLLLLAEITLKSALERGWTTYAESDGIIPMTVDTEGRVWAIGQEEMIHYPDREASVRVRLPDLTDPVMTDPVISIAFDRQSRVWAQTTNGRLGIEEADNLWSFYNPENLESPMAGQAILFDVKGQAWINGTQVARIELDAEHGIYRLVGAGLGTIDALAIDLNGQLWALSAMGELKKLDLDDRWVTITILKKSDPDTIWAFSSFGPARLFIDHQGRAWIGEANGIVHLLETNGVLYTYTPNELHPAIYNGIVVDHEDNLWGVSGYQGLYSFNIETGWTAYNPRNSGLPDPFATALVVDGEGRVWFGSYSAGLTRMDPAEALPAQYVPLLGSLSAIVIPAGLVSILAAAVYEIFLAIAVRKPDRKPQDSRIILFGVFSATLCGLYVLGQRDLFANQVMEALLGEHWSHGDFFAMIVAPVLSICLVPVAAIIGAAIGIFVVRLFLRAIHRDRLSPLQYRRIRQ